MQSTSSPQHGSGGDFIPALALVAAVPYDVDLPESGESEESSASVQSSSYVAWSVIHSHHYPSTGVSA
jgi:hypothetical protein